MKLFIGLVSSLLLLFLVPNVALAQIDNQILGTVVSVGDGDTIRVNVNNKSVTIRLGCIDSPEMKRTPWGEQSRQRLQTLLPVGIQVDIRKIDTDKYGRTVGEVVTSNTWRNINLEMVSEGQAVVYTQYLSGCSANKNEYLNAEAKAKQQRLGYWNQSNPVMPWDYRRETRNGGNVNANPQSGLPSCTQSDCNCPDFKTQAEAQRVLEALERKSYERSNNDVYASINKDIKFKIIALWERDPTTSGERIRWIVPKGSDAIYE